MRAIDGNTIGLEYENDNLPRYLLSRVAEKLEWAITGDASVETNAYKTKKGIVLTATNEKDFRYLKNNLNLPTETIGGEIISPVLTLENLRTVLPIFLELMRNYGSVDESYRSGLHFHVSCNSDLARLKNFIWFGCKYEALMFYLGGMGYKFRGIELNDSMYCRPITEEGPPVVDTRYGMGQIFNVKDLFLAINEEDFWDKMGESRRITRRYQQPARYSWLNFMSMNPYMESFHGTVEFRIFNFTVNERKILAMAELCQKITQYIIKNSWNGGIISKTLEINSIFSTKKERVLQLFYDLMDRIDLSRESFIILEKLVRNTEEFYLKPGFIRTHKSTDTTFFYNTEYCTAEIIEKVRKPKILDRHSME